MIPYQATNPFTQEKGSLHPFLTQTEAEKAINGAVEAQKEWATYTPETRATYLVRLAAVLREEAEPLAKLATWEMGKHIREARAEVERSAAICDYYAKEGPDMLQPITRKAGVGTAYISYQPLGVVLAVMPWNFPYRQVIRAVVPTLLSGNAVLLKHSEVVQGCAHALEKAFTQAGFPSGLFQNLFLPHSLTEFVLAHPSVSALTLTGSERAGREVGALAAKYLKKSVLELGGSDACIVLADADLEAAAKGAAESRLLNTGQSCIAAKRFIVESAVYEEFAALFCQELAAKKFGDPNDESNHFGPMVNRAAATKLQTQVEESIALGAKVRLQGGKGEGAFFYPIVLENVHPGMPAFHEELFGPAAVLYQAADADDAIRIANQSAYGLGGAIWTKDLAKAAKIGRQIQTGSIYVNSIMKSEPMLPFGGVKNSGHGRELGEFGLHEFVNVQTLVLPD